MTQDIKTISIGCLAALLLGAVVGTALFTITHEPHISYEAAYQDGVTDTLIKCGVRCEANTKGGVK